MIVGSGIYGLTVADLIASKYNKPLLVIERRNHIGGNVWSEIDDQTGIEVHKYGSHIFHTSNDKVWSYVNRFTKFNDYKHHVWARHANRIYPLPISLATISNFYGKSITPEEVIDYLPGNSPNEKEFDNLETKAISLIGQDLYDAFIKNYTMKQWQTDPKLLPQEIITRLPVRRNFNTRYFNDKYEGIPAEGYAKMVSNMVENPLISVKLDTDYFNIKNHIPEGIPLIYTGEIDRYFDYKHGRLNWRTLDFEIEKISVPDFQGTSVVNYSDLDSAFTRIHEFKHFHPEWEYGSNETIICREYSRMADTRDEPYYPVNTSEDREKMKKYRADAAKEKSTHFGGRLGSYQYLDMHMAIASAFVDFENSICKMIDQNL